MWLSGRGKSEGFVVRFLIGTNQFLSTKRKTFFLLTPLVTKRGCCVIFSNSTCKCWGSIKGPLRTLQVRLKFSLSFCFVCLDIQGANFLLIATTKEGMIFTRQEYYVWEMRLMPRGQLIALLPLGSLCLVSLRV